MKKLFYLFVFLLSGAAATAQQLPAYSSFYAQPIIINPAYVGHSDAPQAFLLGRKQWVGIPDSPESQLVNIDGDITENMGVGLMVTNDRQNIIGRTGVYASYKYSLKVAEESAVNFGVQGGAFQNKIYFNDINANDVTDKVLLLSTESQLVPDVNVGLMWQWKRLEVGLSGYQLLANRIVHENQATFRESSFQMIRHFNASLRYSFQLGEKWNLDPYVAARSVQGMSIFGDVGLFANYENKMWFGGGYRYNSDAFFSVGGQLFEKVQLSYIYELPMSSIAPHTSGSHEVVLGFNFRKTEEIQNKKNRRLQKQINELEEQSLKQYEQIDQLNRQIETLTKKLDEQQKTQGSGGDVSQEQIDELRQELLEKLREESKLRREMQQSEMTQDAYESKKEALQETGSKTTDDALVRENRSQKLQRQAGVQKANVEDFKTSLDELRNVEMDEPEQYDYYVVLGAYVPEKYAKLYQEYLKEDEGMDSQLIRREDGKYYFTTTSHVNDIQRAADELESKIHEDFLINGNPWVYKKPK